MSCWPVCSCVQSRSVGDAGAGGRVLGWFPVRIQAGSGPDLVYDLKVFARLEADGLAGSDVDFRAGARIAADAGLAGLDGEDAESAEFDAVALNQAVLHGVEDGIDGVFRFGADESGAFYNPLNEILFDQDMPRVAASYGLNPMVERGLAIVNA